MTLSALVLAVLGVTTVLAWGVAIRDVVRDIRERYDLPAATPRHAPGAAPDEVAGIHARRDRDADDPSRSRRVSNGRHAAGGPRW